ncbi:MAG: flagellar hook-length control protein [Mycobacterium sp.]|jgi:hypothetical protein|nr:MAG: flagellar hook-length control protein [Mycobacterium sp.]
MTTDRMTADDVIRAATSVARDAAEGRLNPADLDAKIAATCAELIDTDAEPGSPLAEVQAAVARRALAAGLLPAAEVSEWAAVAKTRAGGSDPPTEG